MKTYRAFWKLEPTIEIEKEEELEQAITDMLVDITMNPHDFIDFEEVDV